MPGISSRGVSGAALRPFRAAFVLALAGLLSSCAEGIPAVEATTAPVETAVRAAQATRSLSGSYTVGEITLETRYWDGLQLPSSATAASVFNGLSTSRPGYTNEPYPMPHLAGTIKAIRLEESWADTIWAGIRNPEGAHFNVATRYRVVINALTPAVLAVQFGVDFLGGAMYVDGSVVAENWNDPWWVGVFQSDTNTYAGCTKYVKKPCLPLYTPNPQTLWATVSLTRGLHVLEVIGFENGSDAGAAARIDAGNGYQPLVSSVQPAQTLTVTRPGAGAGRVVSTPAGLDCTTACGVNFPLGTTVSLTPIAAPNAVFVEWTGRCSGASTCTVGMYGAREVGAKFVGLPSVTSMTMETRFWDRVSFTKTGAGAMSLFNALPTNVDGYTNEPVPVTSFVKNEALFTAPNVGARVKLASRYVVQMSLSAATSMRIRFSADVDSGGVMLLDGTEIAANWSDVVGVLFEVPVTLSAGTHTIQIVGFEGCCDGFAAYLEYNFGTGWISATAPPPPPTPLIVSIPSAGGNVISSPAGINCVTMSCQASFATGSQVILTAVPKPYFAFSRWGDPCAGSALTCSMRMLLPSRGVQVEFVRVAWPVTFTTSGTGAGVVTASPEGVSCGTNCQSWAPGTSVTFTAAPDANSDFAGWTGASCTTTTCTVTVNSALTLTAKFMKKQAALTVTKGGSGTGTVTSSPAGINCGRTCTASFDLGTVVTLTAAGTSGAQFAGWSGACSGMGTCTVTMDAAATVTAQFTKSSDTSPPTLSCSASPDNLYPPNHKLVDIKATVLLQDAGSGPGGFTLLSVTSSEPDDEPEKGRDSKGSRGDDKKGKDDRHKKHAGPGHHGDDDDCGYDDDDDDDEDGDGSTSNDIQGWTIGTADITGQLRAERAGRYDGRVYTLTYRGTDVAGNSTTASCTVTVEKRKGRGK